MLKVLPKVLHLVDKDQKNKTVSGNYKKLNFNQIIHKLVLGNHKRKSCKIITKENLDIS